MDYSSWFLQALLEKENVLRKEDTLQKEYLPFEILSAFSDLPQKSASANPLQFLFHQEYIFEKMHISWKRHILQSVDSMYADIVAILLSDIAQDEEKKKISDVSESGQNHQTQHPLTSYSSNDDNEEGLERKAISLLQPKTAMLDDSIKHFLYSIVFEHTVELDISPFEEIQDSPYIWLFSLTYESLLELIDLLAIYDVVEEVRRTVNKKILMKILTCLTQTQRAYLRTLLHTSWTSLHQDDPCTLVQKLHHNTVQENIKRAMHQKGLCYFAATFEQESDTFIWYITHKLDLSRGMFIQKQILHAKQGMKNSIKVAKLHDAISHAYRFLNFQQSKTGGK